MILRINGVVDEPKKLLNDIVEDTRKEIESLNRKQRRSKIGKGLVALLGLLTTLGFDAIAKAQDSLDYPGANGGTNLITGFWKFITTHSWYQQEIPRDQTFLWKLNEYASNTIFTNHNFFTNSSIQGYYHTVALITLPFISLLLAKKGIDLIKSHAMKTQTSGGIDMVLRILCSFVITFLGMKVESMGIDLSNVLTHVFMKNTEHGMVNLGYLFDNKGQMGEALWTIGYVVMFIVLGLKYWVRQINMVILGVLTPVASLAWVTDGGAMLGTLIAEFVRSLATPVVQGMLLSLGTIIVQEVSHDTTGFISFISTTLINLSTIFLVVTVPDFLNKFIHNSFNPASWALKTALAVKKLPVQHANFLFKKH